MGDEAVEIYFPTTIGSFWVYEEQDGNEFTRTAVEGEEIDGETYQAFSIEPDLEDWKAYNPYLHSSIYDINETGINLLVGEDFKKTLQARLESECDVFHNFFMLKADPGATLDVSPKTQAQDNYLLLPDAVEVNEEWDSVKTSAEISLEFQDPGMQKPDGFTFVFDIIESGKALEIETVEVSTGTFEECLKVEYRTETKVSVMTEDA